MMDKMLELEAVEKVIDGYFKSKVDELPKELDLKSHTSLCELYLGLNRELLAEIRKL